VLLGHADGVWCCCWLQVHEEIMHASCDEVADGMVLPGIRDFVISGQLLWPAMVQVNLLMPGRCPTARGGPQQMQTAW
jgi:hypothetical protein